MCNIETLSLSNNGANTTEHNNYVNPPKKTDEVIFDPNSPQWKNHLTYDNIIHYIEMDWKDAVIFIIEQIGFNKDDYVSNHEKRDMISWQLADSYEYINEIDPDGKDDLLTFFQPSKWYALAEAGMKVGKLYFIDKLSDKEFLSLVYTPWCENMYSEVATINLIHSNIERFSRLVTDMYEFIELMVIIQKVYIIDYFFTVDAKNINYYNLAPDKNEIKKGRYHWFFARWGKYINE